MRMSKSIVSQAVFFVLTIMSSLPVYSQDYPTPIMPEVVGHRGHSAVAPENTLSAIRQNIKTGAQGCEMDVYITKDGQLVLFHDGSLNRCVRDEAGKPVSGKIADYDLATLRTFDFGVWKGEQFRGEKVATYDQALDLLKDSDCIPVVEIKVGNIEPQIIQGLRDRGLEKRAVIIAFSETVVTNCRKLAPEICCAWLVSKGKNESSDAYSDRIIATVKRCGTDMVDMHYGAISAELLKKLADNGITVMCWTVDNPDDIKRMFDLGVGSVTTNVPDVALGLSEK